MAAVVVGVQVDSSGLLHWAFNAISTIGRATVPLQMLILGAKLAEGSLFNLKGGLGIKANFGIAVAKLVLMP